MDVRPWTVLSAGLLTLFFVGLIRSETVRDFCAPKVMMMRDKLFGPPGSASAPTGKTIWKIYKMEII